MMTGERLDRIRTALTGAVTRKAVVDYLRLIALIMFILLAIAWTIDLADNFAAIRKRATADAVPLYSRLVPYLLYRSTDMVTRMLPMACFFGAFLAEIGRRQRLETVILAAAGATPVRMLAPVLIVGIALGLFQFELERNWRPAAIAAQVQLGHGGYAARFNQRWIGRHAWFLGGDTAVRAQVLRADSPAMRDALIFQGLRAPRLQTIYSAQRVDPTVTPMLWHMTGVEVWDAEAGEETARPAPDQTIRLDLIPEQLTHFQVPAFYLPNDVLPALSNLQEARNTAIDANVAIWRRRTAWLLPGVLALLGVCLARQGFAGRERNIPRLIALAVIGYFGVVSIKVMWAVGELGGVSAPVSVLASVLVMAVLSAGLVIRGR